MKKTLFLAFALIAAQMSANATMIFDINFTDGGVNTATGSVMANDLGGGLWQAISGSYTVNPGGALHAGTYNLVLAQLNPPYVISATPYGYPGSFVWLAGGVLSAPNSEVFNNKFNSAGNIPIGLEFANPGNTRGINIWGNGVKGTELDKPSGSTGIRVNGALTMTAVPDGGTTLALLGLALGGMATLRRKLGA